MKQKFFILPVMLFISICFSETSFATIVNPAVNNSILPGDPDPAKVKAAIADFKSLSKKEKKEKFKELKAAIRHYKAEKREGKETDNNTLLLVICAIFIPPLAVYLYEGEINSRFWISLLLTLLFWLPGVIYALVIILGNA